MLVTPEQFSLVSKKILKTKMIVVDTETTGLRAYGQDCLFSVIIKAGDDVFYFDYNDYERRPTLCKRFHPISGILNPYQGIIFMHNAKFDMHFLAKEGVTWDNKKVDCTMATARLAKNDHLSLSLDYLTKNLGAKKSDEVKKYISKNKIFQWEHRAGKKRREKHQHFYKVPIEIMQPYAEQDVVSTWALAKHSLSTLAEQSKYGSTLFYDVLRNERRITQVLYRMERRGIPLDEDYTRESFNYYKEKCATASEKFKELTGEEFMDSGKLFAQVFDEHKITYPTTEKGNPSFDEKSLENIVHPIADTIKQYRDSYKKMGSFESLEYFSEDGIIHPNIKQAGTVTGRMSISSPPLQCQEKAENSSEKYLLRRCIVPRPGYTLFMLDYDQMEYRMLLNYAAQMDLIEKINDGLDVHTATAESMGCERKAAKTINFMLLYGGGAQKLADALGISFEEAKYLKQRYFSVLPRVRLLIDNITKAIYQKGYIYNWLGRRYYIARDFAYKGPNYLIQGGCADWIKTAMVNIDEFLKDKKSNLLLQIHDELVFEVHNDEFHIVKKLKEFMENVTDSAPHTHLKYTVGIDYSEESWQDKKTFDLGTLTF